MLDAGCWTCPGVADSSGRSPKDEAQRRSRIPRPPNPLQRGRGEKGRRGPPTHPTSPQITQMDADEYKAGASFRQASSRGRRTAALYLSFRARARPVTAEPEGRSRERPTRNLRRWLPDVSAWPPTRIPRRHPSGASLGMTIYEPRPHERVDRNSEFLIPNSELPYSTSLSLFGPASRISAGQPEAKSLKFSM